MRPCVVAGVCDFMPCYHPIVAYRRSDGSIVFHNRGDGDQLQLACGQCIGCRLERSRQWAVRCVHEARSHDSNSFVTLTYNNENLPEHSALVYSHFQLFMKRLRKRIGKPIRFFMCGEYGEEFNRPHYHACIFGYDFPDRKIHSRTGSNHFIYYSQLLSDCWPHGFSSCADFSFETAAYVARYVCKKVTGQAANFHYQRVDPDTGECFSIPAEFCHMSLKPGIGFDWYSKYGRTDVEVRDSVVINGVECSVPRYYMKLLRRNNLLQYNEVKAQREFANYLHRGDNTDERLAVKEIVKIAQISKLCRS